MDIDKNAVEVYAADCIDIDTTCEECGAEFLEPEDLEMHVNEFHKKNNEIESGSEKNKCQLCQSYFFSLEECAHHIINTHFVNLEGCVCMYCKRVFTDSNLLTLHEAKHKGKIKNYACSCCGEGFDTVKEVEIHQDEQHKLDSDGISLMHVLPHLCSLLNIKPNMVFQILHVATDIECVKCKYSTKCKEAYKQHLLEKKCVSYTCELCSDTYGLKALLANHMATHMGQKRKKEKISKKIKIETDKSKVKCTKCKIMFENPEQRNKHVCGDSKMGKILKCPHCPRILVGQQVLDKHVKQTHGDYESYKYVCSTCNLRYKHPKVLFGHIFRHHPEIQPFTCKICDLKFRRRSKFSIHIKMAHNSVGYVKHDDKLHVEFTDEKPPPVEVTEIAAEYEEEETPRKKIKKEKLTQKKPKKEKTVCTINNNRKHRPRKKYIVKKPDIDSEDEPLVGLRKKARMKKISKLTSQCPDESRILYRNLICPICNKYCYTYQNFNHHLSLHEKNNMKKCIKCSKAFRSANALKEHVETAHTVSKLTETLKNILARKKQRNLMFGGIESTMKKVEFVPSGVTATITPVPDSSDVRDFIENFSPELSEKKEKKSIINEQVTIKLVDYEPRESFIKMTKFELKPPEKFIRLKMPIKFKNSNYNDKFLARIRPVTENEESQMMYDTQEDTYIDEYHITTDNNENGVGIDNVALDIEVPQTRRPYKKRAKRARSKFPKVQVAILTDEPPYYKIVTVDQNQPEIENDTKEEDALISLPTGHCIKPINPLESLMGDMDLEDFRIQGPQYYKPKVVDYKEAIVKALSKHKLFDL